MFDYGVLEATAEELITEFGQSCSVTIDADSEYDIETGGVISGSHTHYGQCVFGNLTEKHIGVFAGAGGANLIQAGDALVTASASCSLVAGALLECNGERWRVINVLPIKPAAVVVVDQAQVRSE